MKVNDPRSNDVSSDRIIKGVIVVNENKPEFGSIMFSEETLDLSGGFTNVKTKIHFQGGKLEDLEKQVDLMNLKPDGEVKGFKILVEETLEPSFEGQQVKINPSTQEELTKDGKNIYINTQLISENDERRDVYIIHDSTSSSSNKSELDFIAEGSKSVKKEF